MGCHRVFAFLSMGADTKANTLELVRVRRYFERLHRGVALEALCERGCSLGDRAGCIETASEGGRGGV